MAQFPPDGHVCVDVPNIADPDFDAYHGRHGEVVQLLVDTASGLTCDPEDSVLYRVEFADGSVHDFREHGPQPPIK